MADQGTGTTIVFGTSGFTADIESISLSGIERESIPTSHLGTVDWQTFMPADLADPGESSLNFQFDPADADDIPINAAAETITITWPDGTTRECSGFIRSGPEVTAEFNQKMMASAVIKWTGTPTWTPA